MVNQQHHFSRSLLKKAISVTLVLTILLSMVIIGNVFGTAAFAAEGDYTYSVLSDGTAKITKYSGTESNVTVPAALGGVNVSEIGEKAFQDNDEIESVIISDGIKTIGTSAFADCDMLESIEFSPSVETIGKEAFRNCRGLQAVDIPSTVKTIEEKAFSACPILGTVTLHEGLEKMGSRFIAGTVVSEIYIPTTVTNSNESFAETELLETVIFGEGITEIPRDMFEENNSLRTLTIPDTVTKIGDDAFCQMKSLESIEFPDNVTELGTYICYQDSKLTKVTFGSGLTAIPSNAFEQCTDLKEVTIPANITSVGNFAFKDCSRLGKVTFNEGLTSLGSYSFERSAVNDITLPASLQTGGYSFRSCASLKSIKFADGTTKLIEGLLQESAVESLTIPEGVTEIPTSFCNGCKKLTTISLPSTLRTIGTEAFSHCTSLDNVVIPKSVKTIKVRAFGSTTSLKSFTLQEGIQTMESSIFEYSALTSIYIPKTLSTTDGPFMNSNITDVTFNESLATFTDKLFYGAHKLTDITIPDTIVKLGNSCLRETNVEVVIIPDNVKTIGNSAFEQCDNLCAVQFGAGVRKLPQWCFYGCDILQNVIIPETVNEMDANVFEASGISYQKLPQSIKSIPYQSFKDCKNLTEVVCSDALESIGDYAFERCSNLTTLTTAAEDVSFNNTTFKDCPKFKDPRFYVFNPANTGIESTGNIGSDNTLVHFTVKYDIRDDWKKDDTQMRKMYLNIPNGIDIVTNSFSADGFSFDNGSYTGDYKSFDMTDGKTRGELRFSAYIKNSSDAVKNLSADIEFKHNGTVFCKPVGDVQFTTAKLSIFAPSTITDSNIIVSGYTATADNDVTVTINRLKSDGTKDCTVSYKVTPNKYTGKYTSDKLNIVPDGKTAINEDEFEVYAESGSAKSDVIKFTYVPGAVKIVKAYETVNITKFNAPYETSQSHGGQVNDYDITDIFNKGTSPVVSINPKEMLRFRFKLENDENIGDIVLMSHKGDEWKFMPLYYDAKTGMWIGEGYFDIADHELNPTQNYVPGALNLFFFYGEREDSYRSRLYGSKSDKNPEPVGTKAAKEEIFYYDKDGNPHGNLGDYHETGRETLKNVFKDIVTGKWKNIPKDVTVGGLKSLWQWGNTDHNFFRLTHGGAYIGPDGLPVLPGDDADMYNRDASKDGRQRNAIDPSGIVYEAVEGNRVEGATATIYKLNEETNEWEPWNAEDYEQQNPILTNDEGAYAWLTDEGKFKVKISKEGYEEQTSEEFEIPPEKLGLNFSLVDKTTHPVASVSKNEETNSYTLKFSKFMAPDTVTADTVQIEGLTDVSIEPVYLSEGDEYADTFTVKGKRTQKEIKFNITDSAKSYSGVTAEVTTETIVETFILGDVNCDGEIDVTDATLVQQAVAEIVELTDDQKKAADTDGDGEITINDATMIQKYAAELIDHFGE